MKPILFTFSGFNIYGYGLMMALALIGSIVFAEYYAKHLGLDKEFTFNLGLYAVVVGVIGSKLLYFITIFDQLISSPLEVLKNSITEGFVVYGGVILAVIFSYFWVVGHKKPFFTYFDMAAPAIALGQGIGRIGCFLAGCCYGIETDAWYGITFPEGSHAPAGVSLFPVQPVSAALNFINVAVLIFANKKFKYKGQTCALYMINYGIGRFFIEFVRNDYRGEVGIFSTSQFISLFVTALGLVFMFLLPKFSKENMITETTDEAETPQENDPADAPEEAEAAQENSVEEESEN